MSRTPSWRRSVMRGVAYTDAAVSVIHLWMKGDETLAHRSHGAAA